MGLVDYSVQVDSVQTLFYTNLFYHIVRWLITNKLVCLLFSNDINIPYRISFYWLMQLSRVFSIMILVEMVEVFSLFFIMWCYAGHWCSSSREGQCLKGSFGYDLWFMLWKYYQVLDMCFNLLYILWIFVFIVLFVEIAMSFCEGWTQREVG